MEFVYPTIDNLVAVYNQAHADFFTKDYVHLQERLEYIVKISESCRISGLHCIVQILEPALRNPDILPNVYLQIITGSDPTLGGVVLDLFVDLKGNRILIIEFKSVELRLNAKNELVPNKVTALTQSAFKKYGGKKSFVDYSTRKNNLEFNDIKQFTLDFPQIKQILWRNDMRHNLTKNNVELAEKARTNDKLKNVMEADIEVLEYAFKNVMQQQFGDVLTIVNVNQPKALAWTFLLTNLPNINELMTQLPFTATTDLIKGSWKNNVRPIPKIGSYAANYAVDGGETEYISVNRRVDLVYMPETKTWRVEYDGLVSLCNALPMKRPERYEFIRTCKTLDEVIEYFTNVMILERKSYDVILEYTAKIKALRNDLLPFCNKDNY